MTTSLDEILNEYIKDYQVEHAKKAILSWTEKEIVPKEAKDKQDEMSWSIVGYNLCRTKMLERLKECK